jgi:hypothetical protein
MIFYCTNLRCILDEIVLQVLPTMTAHHAQILKLYAKIVECWHVKNGELVDAKTA